MSVKTITIDMEAYDLMNADKRAGESFSKVIKRRFRTRSSANNLLERIDSVCLDSHTLNETERVVADRSKSLTDSPIL